MLTEIQIKSEQIAEAEINLDNAIQELIVTKAAQKDPNINFKDFLTFTNPFESFDEYIRLISRQIEYYKNQEDTLRKEFKNLINQL